MIVVDAYAVLALLKGERGAADVEALLVDRPEARLTVLGVAEVVDDLVRLAGVDEEDAALDVAQLGLADPVRSMQTSASRPASCGPGTTTVGTKRSAWPTAWSPRPPARWALRRSAAIPTSSTCAGTRGSPCSRCRTAVGGPGPRRARHLGDGDTTTGKSLPAVECCHDSAALR